MRPQLVDDRLFQHEAHAAFGHGVADFQAERRDLGDGLLHLDEQVPNLGAVSVDYDELITLADDVDHQPGGMLGVSHLLFLQSPFVFGEQGVAAEGDEGDPLLHQNPLRTSLRVGEPISSSS
jgi:hypothetical protein